MLKKVMVAMSGGVDSSVAAFLLKEVGYSVTGVTMCLGAGSGGESRCCGLDAVADAKRVCDHLQLPHYAFDFSREMDEKIISRYIAEYSRGRTPNPCIDCNRHLKFGSLLAKAEALGFDYLATGHYAAIVREKGKFFLKRPRDKEKDQTYFLYVIPCESLGKILFPLAPLTKAMVRELARKSGLPVAEKTESQDLCFVGKHAYPDFVARHMGGAEPGPIVDRDGRRLGTHRGIVHYTTGQRSGLGIAHSVPLYVLAIDAPGNRLIVGEKWALKAPGLLAGEVHLLANDWPREVEAKIRYRRPAACCVAVWEDDKVRVSFPEPEEAITPGQAVVFYNGDYVLGGGVIEEVLHAVSGKNQ
ncbi:MAG: tRNA 2-thiouridine(34) synthase MnmA [Syntrophales bacterium]